MKFRYRNFIEMQLLQLKYDETANVLVVKDVYGADFAKKGISLIFPTKLIPKK